MSRTILALLAAAVLVLQAACLPLKTQEPLGTLDQAQVEESTLGAWELKPAEGAPLYLHIGLSPSREHEKLMSYSTARVEDDGRLSVSTRAFYVVELAGKQYAHLLDPAVLQDSKWNIEAITSYDLYRIECEGDTLRLFAIDRQAVGELVNSGQLEGEVTVREASSGLQVTSVRLTGSSESLREYLERGGELFSSENAMEFTRVPE